MMVRTFDSAGDANAASSWFQDGAVATCGVAERLMLDGPMRARRR